MKKNEINIRDPFVLEENSKYYMYGTRAANFGQQTGGFDVYVSDDLENWSTPIECFNSNQSNLNSGVNWAPEVHKYNGNYYMFATFTKENNLRGTYILRADNPAGPFAPHSKGAVTPSEWECLDGTLYINKQGEPYIVFCHEHTQIIDGTICYVKLKKDLTEADGEPVTMFAASEAYYVDKPDSNGHYITDGPFMYKTAQGELLMIWSTFINGRYAQCLAKSDNGEIDGKFIHLSPLITDDGGHGMIFKAEDKLILTFHSPNRTDFERPVFKELGDTGKTIEIKE